MKFVNVRLFAAAAFAPFLLASLLPSAFADPPASSPKRPVRLPPFAALPSARPNTSPTRITVWASYDNPSRPVITVVFPTSATVPTANVVEYHVYRNNVLVSRITRLETVLSGNRLMYQDVGSTLPITPVTNNHVNYVTVNIGDPSQLSDARSLGVGPFSMSVPLVYRVTVLYAAQGAGGRTIYNEIEVGRSNAITPFR